MKKVNLFICCFDVDQETYINIILYFFFITSWLELQFRSLMMDWRFIQKFKGYFYFVEDIFLIVLTLLAITTSFKTGQIRNSFSTVFALYMLVYFIVQIIEVLILTYLIPKSFVLIIGPLLYGYYVYQFWASNELLPFGQRTKKIQNEFNRNEINQLIDTL